LVTQCYQTSVNDIQIRVKAKDRRDPTINALKVAVLLRMGGNQGLKSTDFRYGVFGGRRGTAGMIPIRWFGHLDGLNYFYFMSLKIRRIGL